MENVVEPAGFVPPAVVEEDAEAFVEPAEPDPDPVEADGLPEADDPAGLEAVDEDAPEVAPLAEGLVPDVDEAVEEEGEEDLLVPVDACDFVSPGFPSVEAVLPDFGTLVLEDEAVVPLPLFASIFSAFRSMVTGLLGVPVEEGVLLLSGLSDDPGPLPPEEEAPPEDFLSVAI
ncbi:hypothetical protein ABLO27_25730 [Roseibium sp. SCPC15]|uniref:hypothetical protein n=1 Tax=Roseibium sp. SCP15 TaxID=3141376 RepID=UPI0033390FE4